MSKLKYAIIVAGGSGSRMGATTPKQFLEIKGYPVIFYSINAFWEADPATRVIVVLPSIDFHLWSSKLRNLFPGKDIICTPGGVERFLSVFNGLKHVTPNSLVAIHDAARPLVSPALINNLYRKAEINHCAIPAINPPETVRIKSPLEPIDPGNPSGAPKNDPPQNITTSPFEETTLYPRDRVFLIQTPQIFEAGTLKKAYDILFEKYPLLTNNDPNPENASLAKSIARQYTDDAAIWENAGNLVFLEQGDPINIKITLPHDLVFAEYLFNLRFK
ncbi:MAG: 2-C-methyl-D-erythritol 4-phosphate cytidylyltransferase [Bacteroidales bacterium]|jgi:2-C-methyl-D-erythritol 4-phosphate cytidylyltransferase|nr:2-C-methyl-D-erythritol 4-phosphate cytidylyltransferase [Bacteroidales bacterium]NPV35777.1 2-C-methyl-D-erythritol 4-phosphate cytidylyltransferase [Bacteroidales bacterium]